MMVIETLVDVQKCGPLALQYFSCNLNNLYEEKREDL